MQNFVYNFRALKGDLPHRCRICMSANGPGLVKTPCGCSGSIGYVHSACLIRWMETSRNIKTCEICRERYQFIAPGSGFKTMLSTFVQRPLFKLLKFLVVTTTTVLVPCVKFLILNQCSRCCCFEELANCVGFWFLLSVLLNECFLLLILACFSVNITTDFLDSIKAWWRNSKDRVISIQEWLRRNSGGPGIGNGDGSNQD